MSNDNPMYGWMGRILMVDLGSGTREIVSVSNETRRRYLGGRGLGVK